MTVSFRQRPAGETADIKTPVREPIHRDPPATMPRSYQESVKTWLKFARDHGCPAAPATQDSLIEFIDFRVSAGIKPQTIAIDIYEISSYHRELGEDDPITDEVKELLRIIRKMYESPPKIIPRINQERLELIKNSALKPRGTQSFGKARKRGETDIALISVMRDGLLLCRDVKDMRWCDITEADDGSGELQLRNPLWRNVGVYISPETMKVLAKIREGAKSDESVFKMSSGKIYERVRKAAEQAGLGKGYTTDSPRMGMAEDLIKAGRELPVVMAAGRWMQPHTLLRHFRKELAARGTVARMYKSDKRDKPWLK